MTKKISDHEYDLDDSIAAIRSMASVVSTDGNLTDSGKAEAFSARVRLDGARERGTAAADAMRAAFRATKETAAAHRAKMTTQPADVNVAMLAALNFNRRQKMIDATLADGGMGGVQALIEQATDADLPVLVEYIGDHYRMRGGDTAKAGEQIVEQSLRARSPEYSAAAQLATQAATAEQVIDQKVQHLQQLAEDHTTPMPSEHSLATKSVNIVSDALGDLDAA